MLTASSQGIIYYDSQCALDAMVPVFNPIVDLRWNLGGVPLWFAFGAVQGGEGMDRSADSIFV